MGYWTWVDENAEGKNDDEGFFRTVSTRIAVVFFVNGRNGDEDYYYGVQNYKDMNGYGISWFM